MSRIRGIEVKVQKEVLQTRKYGLNEILKQNAEEQSSDKDDVEKNQMTELLQKLPKLNELFEVHRKIGEGTFSSVYLGSLRRHAALPSAQRRWFAIKHLVPTAHPARLEHELRCLQDMGGKHNVIGVELCLRHLDTIVFIMPYIPHRKFSELVGEMDAEELRRYMRALLTALRHVHSFGVIHRDVKPSNFLYDRENGRYLLVDFGLAQRLLPAPASDESAPPPPPPPAHAASGRKRLRGEEDSPPEAKRAALDLSVSSRTRAVGGARPLYMYNYNTNNNKSGGVVGGGGGVGGVRRGTCACAGLGAVCAACAALTAGRAPRAGTQGYRPPEVLLKVSAQGTAVDLWACGVVLASALTARYPLLRAGDDATALAELAVLLGTQPLARAARALGRRVVVSAPRRGVCLRRLTARLRGAPPPAPPRPAPCARCDLPAFHCVCRDEAQDPERFDPSVSIAGFPDSAFSLLARLLAADPARRASADEALRHPFITGTY